MTSSAVRVITVYSQNERFYLTSIPHDNEIPSLRGTTSVYENGKPTPVYRLDRGFDADHDSNTLILSNDGEVIFYMVAWDADEKREGLKSINVYKTGKLIKSYTEKEITGCDSTKERCSLMYSNFDKVVDLEKSRAGTPNYKRVFKDGVDEKERFLYDFAIFSFEDTVYLTDAKRQTHSFNLKDGRYLESNSFDNIFEEIKSKGRPTQIKAVTYEAPVFLDFPRLRSGENTAEKLAKSLGLKAGDSQGKTFDRYRWYSFKVKSNIYQDGSIEIEEIDVDQELSKDKILEFFRNNRFDPSLVPKIFEKWNIGDEYFFFRKANDQLARREREEDRVKQRQEFEKRLTLERINGVYIPANLGECFSELDRLLSEVDRNEMRALGQRDDMIRYHLSLGMWMRNKWGLWGGSRLLKYFRDHGISHPEEMSSIILYHYHDWLTDKKNTWRDWESKPNKRQ